MGTRVLCVTPWFPNFPADGRFNFILHSVTALLDEGHDVTILVTRPWIPAPLAMLDASGVHASLRREEFSIAERIHLVRYVRPPGYLLSGWADALYARGTRGEIGRLIRERDIELVHAHTEAAGFGALECARASGVPLVVTLHGVSTAPQILDTPAKRWRVRRTLDGSARVVLVGKPLHAHFAALAGRDDHFRVVPNGFHDPKTASPVAPARPDPVLRLISVSNLDEEKGIGLTLQALARLRDAHRGDWTYRIVGDGADRRRLEILAERLGLRSRVSFLGWLSHDRALEALRGADVFVLPSYREAFGVAYLEAMASGLLAVGVEGQGPEAFIRQGETGLLVKPNDVDSLVAALEPVLARKTDIRKIAAAGRDLVRSEFTWARHAAKLTDIYREALHDA